MRQFALLLACLLWLNQPVYALETSRQELIKQIVKAQGIEEIWKQQFKRNTEESHALAQKALNDVVKGLNISSPIFLKKMEPIIKSYVNKLSTQQSTDDLMALWVSLYSKDLSDQDLVTILAYSQSAVGQKERQASLSALEEFSKIVMDKRNKQFQEATAEYVAELRAMIQELTANNETP